MVLSSGSVVKEVRSCKEINLTECVNYPGMIWEIADEEHSLSYVTNRQTTKQPGETRKCKGYF